MHRCHHLLLELGTIQLVRKKKRRRGQGLLLGKKKSIQFSQNSRNNTIKFINKPFSNIDLLHWVKQLGIKYFRGIYSRDISPEKIHRLETGIINLDDSIGRGSHWVCYRNVDKQFCEFFDPFGLIKANEIKNYLKTRKRWCFVWLLVLILSFERQKGRSLFNS